jgi:hypothetical protein
MNIRKIPLLLIVPLVVSLADTYFGTLESPVSWIDPNYQLYVFSLDEACFGRTTLFHPDASMHLINAGVIRFVYHLRKVTGSVTVTLAEDALVNPEIYIKSIIHFYRTLNLAALVAMGFIGLALTGSALLGITLQKTPLSFYYEFSNWQLDPVLIGNCFPVDRS